jgi:hypothetical protein
MNHELVHVTASDQATGADSFFRKVFFGRPTRPRRIPSRSSGLI